MRKKAIYWLSQLVFLSECLPFCLSLDLSVWLIDWLIEYLSTSLYVSLSFILLLPVSAGLLDILII